MHWGIVIIVRSISQLAISIHPNALRLPLLLKEKTMQISGGDLGDIPIHDFSRGDSWWSRLALPFSPTAHRLPSV